MALQKSFENDEGVSFEYWRVMPSMSVDFASREARATLAVYASAAARQANKRPVNVHSVIGGVDMQTLSAALFLSGQDFETALGTGDLRAAFYAKVKALPIFSGSQDC